MAVLVSAFFLLTHILTANSSDLCSLMSVDQDGLHYQGGSEFFPTPISLSFPQVYVDKDGRATSLPRASIEGENSLLLINGTFYRNVNLRISLRPYLPDFLLPYLSDYWESWGERVPYVGEWTLSFEEDDGTSWVRQEVSGEITPACLGSVADDLLADADFNGNPSAFWNNKVIRE